MKSFINRNKYAIIFCALLLAGGYGGYKFMDYVKAGTGLVIVCFAVSLVVIPMVWPFFP